MGLSSLQALSVVIIVYFAPVLVAAGWICYSRGLGYQFGWLYLSILALARIIGASLQVAAQQDGSNGLSTAARIIGSSGLVALILVMLELVQKIKENLVKGDSIPPVLWRLVHLSQWAAFILSIIGMANGNDRLSKAATIIMAVIFAALSFISIVFALQMRHLLEGHKRILMLLLCSIPFLAIRVLYGLLNTFVTTGRVFGGSRPNVVALALLQYLMEFIVVALYLVAGLSAASWKAKESDEEYQIQMTRSKESGRQTGDSR